MSHFLDVLGMPGEGVMVRCSCGEFTLWGDDFDQNYDTLVWLVEEHRRAAG